MPRKVLPPDTPTRATGLATSAWAEPSLALSALPHSGACPNGTPRCARTCKEMWRGGAALNGAMPHLVLTHWAVPCACLSTSLRCAPQRRRFTEAAALAPKGKGRAFSGVGLRRTGVRSLHRRTPAVVSASDHTTPHAAPCTASSSARITSGRDSLRMRVPVMAAGPDPVIERGRCGGRARSAPCAPLPSVRRSRVGVDDESMGGRGRGAEWCDPGGELYDGVLSGEESMTRPRLPAAAPDTDGAAGRRRPRRRRRGAGLCHVRAESGEGRRSHADSAESS